MARIKISSDDELTFPEDFAKKITEKASQPTLSDNIRQNHGFDDDIEEEARSLDALFENEVKPYIDRKFKTKTTKT